jgi:hypothetical protein
VYILIITFLDNRGEDHRCINGKIILKLILKEEDAEFRMDSSGSGYRSMACCYQHQYETSGYTEL